MPAQDRNAAGVRGRADAANQLSDTRCCVLNTGDCGTQSGFSKSPPLACWYLPREDEGRPNAGGHSAEGPTPQIPRGGGDVGVSTLALEFAGGRLDRRTKVTLSSAAPAASSAPSSASARGLDWFTFFLADIQTGFGPFVAIYLTAHAWPQFDIGLVLTAGGLVALACQMPGGALVDAVRSARLVAALAVGAICVSALALAIWPTFPVVMATRVLHAGASCVLGPVIAAISLGLVGHAALGGRLGRNARFASIGNGVAAAAMGACGYLVSNQAVFFLTAILAVPAVLALMRIRMGEVGQTKELEVGTAVTSIRSVVTDRRLLAFAGCILLFQLANAAMLPLMGGILTMRSSEWASTLIGACIVVPQLVVALFAPWVGRVADSWGRRPLLVVCFGALALRGILFAVVTDPYLIVAIQALDGVSAAVLGVVLPLVVADITRGTGRFNLGLGIVGSAVGIGAAFSTTLGGYAMDHFGRTLAFSSLATIAACGLALLWLLPETRRVVGALASAAQTAPSLKSERKRSRLSATGMLERIPLDRSVTPPSQQHRCSFPPPEAVQSSRLGRIICHGCR
jgi:MFS family permease